VLLISVFSRLSVDIVAPHPPNSSLVQALNLVEASRVIILDPWWNPAVHRTALCRSNLMLTFPFSRQQVELQAMDRVHRIGQRE
jgi:hypothetical protein